MSKELIAELDLNAEPAMRTIQNIRAEGGKVIDFVNKVDSESMKIYRKGLSMARGMWAITEAMARATGGTISNQFRMIMSASFGLIQTMIPILTAVQAEGLATLNLYQVSQAALGLFELGVALSSLGMNQQQLESAQSSYQSSLSILNSIQMMFNGMDFS